MTSTTISDGGVCAMKIKNAARFVNECALNSISIELTNPCSLYFVAVEVVDAVEGN